jgi:hypothetical protein
MRADLSRVRVNNFLGIVPRFSDSEEVNAGRLSLAPTLAARR